MPIFAPRTAVKTSGFLSSVDRRPTSIPALVASEKGPPKSAVLSFDLLPDSKPCEHELRE